MDPLNKTNTGGRFDHHAGARKIAALVVFLLAAGLVLLGCQPVRLTHVLVGDRMADSGEYAVVTVIRKDQPVRTVPGMEIRKGDTITTDANSWAVIEFDPNARVILTPGTKVQVSSLRLIFGEILAVLKPGGYKKVFEVETEDSIAGPESSIFSVSKVPQGPTTVTVIQGVVKLSSPVQAWPETRVTQYQKAVTPPGRRPEILRMTKDEFNGIVEWANRVENKVRPETPVVLIPDLRMLPKEKAQALLEREGLRIGEIQPKISRPPQPLGTVVDQKPEPGSRVGRGTAVTIGVEVEPVQVPDLRNRPLSEARQILQRRGLVPGEVHWRITGSVPAERVLGHRS
ncbi:MAG: PASTA domain-containing protein [Desulfobacterales bacterium]